MIRLTEKCMMLQRVHFLYFKWGMSYRTCVSVMRPKLRLLEDVNHNVKPEVCSAYEGYVGVFLKVWKHRAAQ